MSISVVRIARLRHGLPPACKGCVHALVAGLPAFPAPNPFCHRDRPRRAKLRCVGMSGEKPVPGSIRFAGSVLPVCHRVFRLVLAWQWNMRRACRSIVVQLLGGAPFSFADGLANQCRCGRGRLSARSSCIGVRACDSPSWIPRSARNVSQAKWLRRIPDSPCDRRRVRRSCSLRRRDLLGFVRIRSVHVRSCRVGFVARPVRLAKEHYGPPCAWSANSGVQGSGFVFPIPEIIRVTRRSPRPERGSVGRGFARWPARRCASRPTRSRGRRRLAPNSQSFRR